MKVSMKGQIGNIERSISYFDREFYDNFCLSICNLGSIVIFHQIQSPYRFSLSVWVRFAPQKNLINNTWHFAHFLTIFLFCSRRFLTVKGTLFRAASKLSFSTWCPPVTITQTERTSSHFCLHRGFSSNPTNSSGRSALLQRLTSKKKTSR